MSEKQAKVKLALLDNVSVWIYNQLELGDVKINRKRLHFEYSGIFQRYYRNHFKDFNQLGLSANKHIEAKEISIRELTIIQEDYERVY